MTTLRILVRSIGFALLALNAAGYFVPLRSADLYHEANLPRRDDLVLTEEELLREAGRRPGEEVGRYVRRLTDAVQKGIANYWDDAGIAKYNLAVPLHENYLLFLARYVYPLTPYAARYPDTLRKYEFSDYRRGIRRGLGQCSQHAIVLNGLLGEQQIRTRIAGLDGHVVSLVEIAPGTWWLADPQAGVVIPHSLEEVEKRPETIESFYRDEGFDEGFVDALVRIFGEEGNRIFRDVREYHGSKKYFLELFSYVLIWVVPVALLLSPLPPWRAWTGRSSESQGRVRNAAAKRRP